MNSDARFARLCGTFYELLLRLPGGEVYRPTRPLDLREGLGPATTARFSAERGEPLVEFGSSFAERAGALAGSSSGRRSGTGWSGPSRQASRPGPRWDGGWRGSAARRMAAPRPRGPPG